MKIGKELQCKRSYKICAHYCVSVDNCKVVKMLNSEVICNIINATEFAFT